MNEAALIQSAAVAMPLVMGCTLPPAAFQRLLRQGLDGATQGAARLRAAASDPDLVQREAHRLRGTAGSFGLARIATLAGAIEARASRHEPIADLLTELDQATAHAQQACHEAGQNAGQRIKQPFKSHNEFCTVILEASGKLDS